MTALLSRIRAAINRPKDLYELATADYRVTGKHLTVMDGKVVHKMCVNK